MAAPDAPRRLIVNADDFGRTTAINAAVREAHREGILTTASLMVNEAAVDEAVAIAHAHRRLGVGLHLSLVCGLGSPASDRPVSGPATHGLTDAHGRFDDNPVRAGIRYFFVRSLRAALQDEIDRQFRRFADTGLELDHINGHLNIHLHPVVFAILAGSNPARQRTGFRLTRDRFRLSARLGRGNWGYRIGHAVIFGLLCARTRPGLRRTAWRHTDTVFGLLENARVDEDYVLALLPELPPGDSELYSHPTVAQPRHEFEALVSARVRRTLETQHIARIRYQDL
ncbi:MAG: hopanoid biosynthesis-associated protein HpnK [Verrucomicrobiales bacterium]|nr:hopanoid biosynthesis-associated protein HpnK [Verrucomicrobiales bacterium]MCP5528032.1 hopanoid biosynthesis-associated protein HpnK [Verrucomicrobiales bacterium]